TSHFTDMSTSRSPHSIAPRAYDPTTHRSQIAIFEVSFLLRKRSYLETVNSLCASSRSHILVNARVNTDLGRRRSRVEFPLMPTAASEGASYSQVSRVRFQDLLRLASPITGSPNEITRSRSFEKSAGAAASSRCLRSHAAHRACAISGKPARA